MWGEARAEPVEGRIAVACVVRNRVQDPKGRYGRDYKGVCLRRYQFSCWIPQGGEKNYQAVQAAARSLMAGRNGPVLEECCYLAAGVIMGRVLDNTRDATHYLTRTLYATKPPSWTAGLSPCAQISEHIFFNNVR
jgi:N-acetylmuramoyl-L-alanine amidase